MSSYGEWLKWREEYFRKEENTFRMSSLEKKIIDFTNQIKELKSAKQPKPVSDETHKDFMKRCTEKGYTDKECMKFHEGYKFKK